jgi:hypothetical protein
MLPFCSSDTVWEYVTDHLGAQSTVLAGGRYDLLVGLLGGPTEASVRRGVHFKVHDPNTRVLLCTLTRRRRDSHSAYRFPGRWICGWAGPACAAARRPRCLLTAPGLLRGAC